MWKLIFYSLTNNLWLITAYGYLVLDGSFIVKLKPNHWRGFPERLPHRNGVVVLRGCGGNQLGENNAIIVR